MNGARAGPKTQANFGSDDKPKVGVLRDKFEAVPRSALSVLSSASDRCQIAAGPPP